MQMIDIGLKRAKELIDFLYDLNAQERMFVRKLMRGKIQTKVEEQGKPKIKRRKRRKRGIQSESYFKKKFDNPELNTKPATERLPTVNVDHEVESML